MILLRDEIDFSKKLEVEENLVIFIFHNWSIYSVAAKNIIEEWNNSTNWKVHIFNASEINHDNFFYRWIENQKMIISPRINGYGEIIWIKRTKIVGFESISQSYNLKKLEERTIELLER